MKNTTFLICFFLSIGFFLHAQDGEITNAFDDLKRQGTVAEEDSEMRKLAPDSQVRTLISQYSGVDYFCFAEDRFHDIRLREGIPVRWIEKREDLLNKISGTAQPGEYYTFQIGVFAANKAIQDLNLTFTDLKGENGKVIRSSTLQCFNLGGVDPYGRTFKKEISVPQGNVQALWIGVDIPENASGTYTGIITVKPSNAKAETVAITLKVEGKKIVNHGDDEGWRKTRLRWLNSTIGNAETPTAPYIPVSFDGKKITYLGGVVELAPTGLPRQIITSYDRSNQPDRSVKNEVLADAMIFVVETETGKEILTPGKTRIVSRTPATVRWETVNQNKNVEVICAGTFNFDGLSNYEIKVTSKKDLSIKDIRLEVPYTSYASKYMMGLGRKGGFRPDSVIQWHWNIDKHQDKVWMGNINSGLNFVFKDENYNRPLVNIYYSLGKLNLPGSWGNENKGGITIEKENNGKVMMQAYSGARNLEKGKSLHYNFNMLITPVKPLNLALHATERFYHSNSDLSSGYIAEAKKAGANMINIHHKKDIYPFINYPYYDEAVPDLKKFIQDANKENIDVRVYYTTRELTVKIPELWALRSLGSEVLHDGPGKDARTLIHREGPNEWLNKNLTTNFIPAWYNAFREGKYAGDMDISVITTPDSRWNNYYLEGLDWMIKNLNVNGVYIDDSALDNKTLQRARRIMDADGKRRMIDIHSWNHMNQWAGYANSMHIYMELLPYVDRTWIGEGFPANNTPDFWLVEMSGIPFGLLSETLDARNQFRGMVYGMLPRLPWSGNPVPLWKLWDEFGMKDAKMYGYWDERIPVTTENEELVPTVYINGNKAMVVIANWTDLPQTGTLKIDEQLLGFKPTKFTIPEIRNLQWESNPRNIQSLDIIGRSGLILLVE